MRRIGMVSAPLRSSLFSFSNIIMSHLHLNNSLHFAPLLRPAFWPTLVCFKHTPTFALKRSHFLLVCFGCDEIRRVCLSFRKCVQWILMWKDILSKSKEIKIDCLLLKFDQTDQRQTVIKINTVLLHVKCFFPIFKACSSSDKKINICYVICEPWALCRKKKTPFHFMNNQLLLV